MADPATATHSVTGTRFSAEISLFIKKKFALWPRSLSCCIVNNKSLRTLMRCSVCLWLTRPSSFFLSFFLSFSLCCLSSNSLKNQICVQWAWVRRFKNQLLDWCQTSCGQLALLFSASALLLPSSTSFQSPSLFFLYLGRPDEEENNVFFFVTLHCIDCLTCQCTVQFKAFFSCIAGRSTKHRPLTSHCSSVLCFCFF